MVDITDVPTNYHEWYGRIKDAEAEFDKLPIEVKNKWDNDVEKYIMAYGTEEWADKMGLLKEKKPTENTTEKKEAAE
jgi:nuclear transport factor 2 (NTF2) superfamily protein